MCTNPEAPWPAWPDGGTNYDYDSVIHRIKARQEEIDRNDTIYIAGGEPTIHPRFLDIWDYIKKNFPEHRLILLSNGRRFFYKEFAAKVLEIDNVMDIDLSLHGPTPEIHESITKAPGSFYQAKEGLKNLLLYKKSHHSVGIRYVITKRSYPYIKDFLKLAYKEFPFVDNIIFIFWEVENHALKNSQALDVSYSRVFPFLEEAASWAEHFKSIKFYHFPLCATPNKLWPYVWRTLSPKEVKFSPLCSECKYKELCLGIPDTYYDYRGEDSLISGKEIQPIKKDVPMELDESNKYHHPINKVFI
jgi:MoaA/NifB/PqqE/SkfB family radical SAM enzyme